MFTLDSDPEPKVPSSGSVGGNLRTLIWRQQTQEPNSLIQKSHQRLLPVNKCKMAIILWNDHYGCLPECGFLTRWIQYRHLTSVLARSEIAQRKAEFEWHCLRFHVESIHDGQWRCFKRFRRPMVKSHKCDERRCRVGATFVRL